MIKRLLIIFYLIFSVNSFAQNNEKPKAINEENNIPEGNVPTSNQPDNVIREQVKNREGRILRDRANDKFYGKDTTFEERRAMALQHYANLARKKGLRFKGPTQYTSNEAFVVPKENQSRFDKNLNRYNVRGAQAIEDHRARNLVNNYEQIFVFVIGVILVAGLGIIFIFRAGRKHEKIQSLTNTSYDIKVNDLHMINKDIPEPSYSNYNGEILKKQLIKKYSLDFFDFCYNHYTSPGITSNILCSSYYKIILPKGVDKNYESALKLINYRNQTLKELFGYHMPDELQRILAKRCFNNISLLIYAQCYYEDITAGNDLFLRNINELIYKCIEIRHNQNCIYQKDIENINYDFEVFKELENTIARYIY